MAALSARHPAVCALTHSNPLELLVATILSAQTTDERVNQVTPALFARMRSAADFAGADAGELEELIHATGFFRAKARSLIAMGQTISDRFQGQVPKTMEELVQIPGVGRKTANVVLGVGFGVPGFAVDTHVTRLTNLLGLVKTRDPVRIEAEICKLVPAEDWTGFSLRLIQHGRLVCVARRPRCELCPMSGWCPSSQLRPKGPDRLGAPPGPVRGHRSGRPARSTSARSGGKTA